MSAECKEIPKEAIALINSTPFLLSLCYDLNLLPEQFEVLKGNPSYSHMYAMLMGVLACYQAMKQNEVNA